MGLTLPSDTYIEAGPEYWHALLIGINYNAHNDQRARLAEPHGDLRLIEDWLLKQCWLKKNIVILSDEKVADESGGVQTARLLYPEPTKDNILRALNSLIKPAIDNPGQCHKFFFYYAGHGAQEPDPTHEEEDDLNECIVPSGSDVSSALNLSFPATPGASSIQLPNLSSPPLSTPPTLSAPSNNLSSPIRTKHMPPKPRRRLPKFKFLPSDCNFAMKMVPGRVVTKRGADGAEKQVVEDEKLKPMPTEDHGWINDDTLCDILCRQLPANCRLRAIFDMCHSGTALDLSHNYTWRSVPYKHRWRFNWVEMYCAPPEREGKRWFWYPKPTVQGDTVAVGGRQSAHPPKTKEKPSEVRRSKSLPAKRVPDFGVTRSLGSIPQQVVKTSRWTFRGVKKIFKVVFRLRHKKAKPEPVNTTFQLGLSPAKAGTPSGLKPLIIAKPTHGVPLIPVLTLTTDDNPNEDALVIDLTQADWEVTAMAAMGSEMTPTTPGSYTMGLDSTSVHASTLHVPEHIASTSGRPRSSSAPPAMASSPSKTKKAIVGDIICLGASADSQVASDDRSLAKLLVELYEILPDHPTHYQLLLFVTRRAMKYQIPQLSSSRDLSTEWHRLFSV